MVNGLMLQCPAQELDIILEGTTEERIAEALRIAHRLPRETTITPRMNNGWYADIPALSKECITLYTAEQCQQAREQEVSLWVLPPTLLVARYFDGSVVSIGPGAAKTFPALTDKYRSAYDPTVIQEQHLKSLEGLLR